MNDEVILDGILCDPKLIDASKHRYISMYRPPFKLITYGMIKCRCGTTLYSEMQYQHWQIGHYDLPVYETIPHERTGIEKYFEERNT
jgi:hypothetical protein